MESIARHGSVVIDAAFALVRELSCDASTGSWMPNLSERCGLLDQRHEVFAMRMPGASHMRLVIAYDDKDDQIDLIGAIPAAHLTGQRLGMMAMGLAAGKLGAVGPVEHADPPPTP